MANEWLRLIDTNVFVYAEDLDDQKKHDKALSIIIESANSSNGMITTQILAEFSKIMGKALNANEINSRIMDYKNSFRAISYNIDDIKKANELSDMYKIHFFDALIVATMDSQGVCTIVTENETDFKKVPWLNIINPFK